MRQYPTNSPEAFGRVAAIAMMADGAVGSTEMQAFERQDVTRQLGLDCTRIDQVFCEYYEDLVSTACHLPNGQLVLDATSIGLLFDEIRDPQLQKQALRTMLDIVNADRQLSGGEASLIAQAFAHWEVALSADSDHAIRPHHLPLGRVAEIHLA